MNLNKKNAANVLAKGFLLNEYSPPKKYADDAVDVDDVKTKKIKN